EGWTYWPQGTNGTSSKTITWICSAICLRLAGSVARIQSRRSFSIGGFGDHPTQPPTPAAPGPPGADRRVQRVGGDPVGREQVPAARAGRILLGPARQQRAPV